MKRQKRIMAINDISCFGKCSLTVAIPILSAADFEVCPVPTALLSTHTGCFKGYTFKNLDDQIMPITEHWKRAEIKFDAIYSGYLGSFKQLEYVKKILEVFKGENVTALIDPVMGDNGTLYDGFERKFAKGMLELCKKADIIVPNITEASYMLDTEYKAKYTEEDVTGILKKFRECGVKNVVITGIPMEDNTISCGIYDNNDVFFVKRDKIEGMYHGTGDVFASALLAGYERGMNLKDAVELAVWYVYESILVTKERYGNNHYGVDFESVLYKFIKKIQ